MPTTSNAALYNSVVPQATTAANTRMLMRICCIPDHSRDISQIFFAFRWGSMSQRRRQRLWSGVFPASTSAISWSAWILKVGSDWPCTLQTAATPLTAVW